MSRRSIASPNPSRILVAVLFGCATTSCLPDPTGTPLGMSPTEHSSSGAAPAVMPEARSVDAATDAALKGNEAPPQSTDAVGVVTSRVLPVDPCSLLALADLEALLGIPKLQADAAGYGYGCAYSTFGGARTIPPGQVRPVMQIVMVAEGESAKRQQLDAYAQLLSSPGCHFRVPLDPSADPTPFAPEIEAMMGQDLADIYATQAKLFRERCASGSSSTPKGTASAVVDADEGIDIRSYKRFDGLGDTATYYDLVRYGYDASHNLEVVSGDRLYTFQVAGFPEFDENNQMAFDTEVALAQRLLGERSVNLDISIVKLGPLRKVAPVPPLSSLGGEVYSLPQKGIHSGMTYSQMASLLGFDGVAGPTRTEETCVWRRSQDQIDVNFTNGVFNGNVILNHVAESDFWRKAKRIDAGMTLADVEQILGPVSERRAHKVQPFTWTHELGGEITVDFENGLSNGQWSQFGVWP